MACAAWLATQLGCAPSPPPAEPAALPAGTAATPAPSASSAWTPLRLTPAEAAARRQAGEDIVIVDVRPVEAYRDEHVTGALNAPWKDLPTGHALLPRDRLLLLYCT